MLFKDRQPIFSFTGIKKSLIFRIIKVRSQQGKKTALWCYKNHSQVVYAYNRELPALFKIFIYLWGGEERNILSPQPLHVLWLGSKPPTSWCRPPCSTNWATPGGAGTSYFRFNSKLLNFSVNVKKYYYKHILSSVKVGKMFLILMFYLKSKHII